MTDFYPSLSVFSIYISLFLSLSLSLSLYLIYHPCLLRGRIVSRAGKSEPRSRFGGCLESAEARV
jgi:hypothetical protein